MPFVPESVPPKRVFDPCVTIPVEYENILPLLANYRRIIEYYKMLSSRPALLPKGLSAGPLEKCLQAIDYCEKTTAMIFAKLEQEGIAKKNLRAMLDKSIASARSLLDMEIRKHADQTGVALIALAKDGLESSVSAFQPDGIAGSRLALFLCAESDSLASGDLLRAELRDQQNGFSQSQSIPLVSGGLNPFAVDFTMGQISNQSEIGLSSGGIELVLPIQCKVTNPSVLSAKIIDAKTKRPVACRVHLTDAYGQFHSPIGSRVTTIPSDWGGEQWSTNSRYSNHLFFYCDGSFLLELSPGKFFMQVVRGFEYEVLEVAGEIAAGETKQIDVPLTRHMDMPALGWHVGQTHVHSQNLMPVNDYSGWEIIPDAEGLEVSFLSIFHQGEEIFTEEYPIGLLQQFSHDNYYLAVGEEFRHVPFGHMTFLNLKKIIPPISSGRLGGKNWPDTPCNGQAIDLAHDQGAVAVYCHFDARGPIVINDELPIDAALGKVDCGEVMGAGGGYKYWYPMLNCGIRIGACAGPDWNIEDCCRVYVHTGKPGFTFQEWMDALRAQRTFVSSGPMLFFTVNEKLPGSVIRGEESKTLSIRGQAISTMPIRKLEILINGVVADAVESADGIREISIKKDFAPEKNCWIALRCFGQGAAHTSPVYVEVNDAPMGGPEDAHELLAISEQCLHWTEKNGIFTDEGAKQEALSMFRQGTNFYRQIVERG